MEIPKLPTIGILDFDTKRSVLAACVIIIVVILLVMLSKWVGIAIIGAFGAVALFVGISMYQEKKK
jgi:hypothetical membrane protein